MYAEMHGKSAIALKLIVDEHSVTKEILQAFEPVYNGVLGQNYDFANINKAANFKTVLKDVNARQNGIFN